MCTVEMRKRVFWSAYALDRNISITLGRPCAIRDEDIDIGLYKPLPTINTMWNLLTVGDAPFPQNLKDDDLTRVFIQYDPTQLPSPQPLDMSTFLHIIQLRQLQSRIQTLFYSADLSRINNDGVQYHRTLLRTELDTWITQAPRYSPTPVTFQSTEWFRIAYSHALLLLYRPSPACPLADSGSLQICADSAISLISITMLYTLHVTPEIRASTTKAVVKSNVLSCLALFEVMSDNWPLVVRCYEIVDRLGSASVAQFDAPSSEMAATTIPGPSSPDVSRYQHFGQIDVEFMEWFGTKKPDFPSSFTALEDGIQNNSVANETRTNFSNYVDFLAMDDSYFPQEFDNSIPLMVSAFDPPP
ncbi:hypothetical protein BDV96DRAFT_629148 [Lophiotrema nucula]|uniref:Xylanolytic transcriptional activator regulatory domain-containing protein n=1 Tax=Lophiotrema nucula TaxID=690887 RepID=A0A6A5ZKC9_9PLEO|nr:hypothetical protein BDV96DRAFT_629148 [Lophiotrema nucula]